MNDNSSLLNASQSGQQEATAKLAELLRCELRQIATGHLKHERKDHTLQPTALVNEAFLRLIDQSDVTWRNSNHFLGIASKLMRRILVDHARAKQSKKRGGGSGRVFLDETALAESPLDVLTVNDLIETLEAAHPRVARVVDMHVFGGLKLIEISDTLSVSISTVKNDWRFAKAWLNSHLNEEG